MGKSHTEIVKGWFTIAKRDLDSAHRLASGPNPYLDTAISHCQQAAEKAVKGFPCLLIIRISPRRMDIRKVVTLAETIGPRFASWQDAAELLTPYATAFRYTDDILESSQDEFDEALKAAADLYIFVLSMVPAETHPKQ